MKRQLFFALSALVSISGIQANYGVYGSANSMSTAARNDSLATQNRLDRMGGAYDRGVYTDRYTMENAPYGRPVVVETTQYETYPAYRPGAVRRAAQDVVSGAETIIEAPLNLLP